MEKHIPARDPRMLESGISCFLCRPDPAEGHFDAYWDRFTEAPAIRFRMGQAGWAYMDVAHRLQFGCFRLSEVCSPFEPLLDWALLVRDGDLPIEVAIAQEGYYYFLACFESSESDRVNFVVFDPDHTAIVQCRPRRNELVRAIQKEFIRFFTSDFDDREWQPWTYNPADDLNEGPILHTETQGFRHRFFTDEQ